MDTRWRIATSKAGRHSVKAYPPSRDYPQQIVDVLFDTYVTRFENSIRWVNLVRLSCAEWLTAAGASAPFALVHRPNPTDRDRAAFLDKVGA